MAPANAPIAAMQDCSRRMFGVLFHPEVVHTPRGAAMLRNFVVGIAGIAPDWNMHAFRTNAIARILFGAVNPSGRLPITFPQSESQLPRTAIPGRERAYMRLPLEDTQSPFDVDYVEGANVGYKWFKSKKLIPLFPFGFGLSYTSFDFNRLKAAGGAALTVTFDMRNTGKREGMATAQVYATPPGGVARLIGWSKLDLKPGETRRVLLTADPRLLANFDSEAKFWRVAEGNYGLALGSSSADISAGATVHMDASTIKP